jgi:mono/diheme cytochrome c family protein
LGFRGGPSVLGRLRRPKLALGGLATVVLAAACGDPPRRFTEPLVLGGREVPPEVLERGARVYGLYCVSCHGPDGSGRAAASRSFETPPRDFREAAFRYVSGPEGSLPTDADLVATIRWGRPGTGMPAWDGLPPEDLHAVIQLIKTFSPRWATEAPPEGHET